MRCGRSLGGAPGPEARQGERRHITAMFCDLVDSTELTQRLDPEELGEAIHAYQDLCTRSIVAHAGTVAQYLGDGLLVYFGYPAAHEDDPSRAVHTALEILAGIPALNAQLGTRLPALRGRPLEARIGIHTGEVVLGTLGTTQEAIATGDTINITARLQGVAEPGSVVISAATRRLVRDEFELEDLGAHELKGIARPLVLHRARPQAGAGGPGSGAALTPFVGRDQELSLLLEHWEGASRGAGRVVHLSGEGGIGKSRLLKVLRAQLAGQPHRWLEARCSPYYEHSAFHPVLNLLEDELEQVASDPAEIRLDKLERALEPIGLPQGEVIPVLARLLSLPLAASYPDLPESAEAIRRRTLDSLAAWLLRTSEREPVVLVLEDLQWVDPSTLELLTLLAARVPHARLLVLLTFRPSFEPPWAAAGAHVRSLALLPLTRPQMARMVQSIDPSRVWSPALVMRLAAKADGVPLFVEELTQAVLESGVSVEDPEALLDLAIPSTLQSSLTARLDRLGSVKEVAQLAAVLGREFSHGLLAGIYDGSEAELCASLAELVRVGLVYREGTPPRASYTFKHALIRDTAYESLLRSARRRIHRRVARALESGPGSPAAVEPELIARHYREADLPADAAPYYQLAGQRAAERSANAEAVEHLRHALDMLSQLDPSDARSHRELDALAQLGVLTMAADGSSDPGVLQVFSRARELCREIGSTPETGLALFGLSVFHQARGELDVAVELGDQLLALAQRTHESSLQVSAHLSLGIPLFWHGQPARAVSHLERATALYDQVAHRALAYAYGQDPGVSAHSYAALSLWQLGSPDRAVRQNRAAIELATDDLSLAMALTWACWVALLRGEVPAVRDYADRIERLSEARGYVLWQGLGAVLSGWAGAADARGPQDVARLEAGLSRLARTGTNVVGPVIAGLYAEALAFVGRLDDAAAAVDAALEMARAAKTPFIDPDLQRLRGELLLRRTPASRAEAVDAIRGALEEARSRGMRSYELRAATSLAPLLCEEGRKGEAHRLLSGVYSGFSEGLDTRDLREARRVLGSLS